MRRVIGAGAAVGALAAAGAALAGGALAGQPATNAKGSFLDISAKATPPVAGTAKVPQGVGFAYDAFAGNRINGDVPSAVNGAVVRLAKGFVINGAAFPACTINTTPNQFSTCSKASRIGSGSGELSLPGANGAPPTFVSAQFGIYNGKPYQGGGTTVIFLATLAGKTAAELDFRAAQQPTGPYGLALTELHLPGANSGPSGLTKIDFTVPRRSVTRTVKGKRVTTYLMQAPTTCHGSWKFSQTVTFSDGTPPLTATDAQPCTPAK